MQRAHSGDKHARAYDRAISRCNAPQAGAFIPHSFPHARIHAYIGIQTKPLRARFQVVLNLVATGIHAGPVRIAIERKRIKVRRDVAGASGILVYVPGAADVISLLNHQEIPGALLQKFDCHPQAGKAGAHNQHIQHARGKAVGERSFGR